MNKTVSIIITLGLVVALSIIFLGGAKKDSADGLGSAENTEIKNGIQYITINAKGGYFPRAVLAKEGTPTKLIVKTNGTYDCSASLAIRSIGYQKILPQTGEAIIDIGIPKAGESLQGICGMGMYSFKINFN